MTELWQNLDTDFHQNMSNSLAKLLSEVIKKRHTNLLKNQKTCFWRVMQIGGTDFMSYLILATI